MSRSISWCCLSAIFLLGGVAAKRSIEANQRDGRLFADRIVLQGFLYDPANKNPIILALPADRPGQWVFDQAGQGIGCTGGTANQVVSIDYCPRKETPREI